MADIKISQLPEVTSLNTSDVAPFVSSGVTSKITLQNIAANMPQVNSSISASIAATASYVEAGNVVGLNLSQISSGSATASISPGVFNVNTNTNVQGNITASNALFTGAITAQILRVQYITASTELVTGSTKFGTQLTDTHQFTGSVSVTGSLSLNGSPAITGTGENGQVSYWSGANTQTGSNNLFWDNTNGRLAIGTNSTSDNTQLKVNSGTGADNIILEKYGDTPNLVLRTALGTISSPIAVIDQTSIGQIGFRGYTGASFAGSRALINAIASQNWSAIANGTNLTFSTTPNGSITRSENLRIWHNGNIAIQNGGTFVDSGFRFYVSGSVRFTNGLQVTGSLEVTSGITGSLFGTSSWAVSASNALTASFALNASGLSTTQIATGSVTASVNINSASFQVTSGSTNLLFVSNSGLITAQRLFLSSSRNMASGSTLVVFGSGSAQPVFTVQGSQGELFSVNDSLSGSLFSVNDISGLPIIEAFSDNRVLIGSYQAPMLTTTVRTTLNSGSNVIYQNVPTASYDAVFFEYSLKSGSNARAGSIMGIWSGSDANYNETVTVDFGDTTGVKFIVMVTGSNVALTGSATTANWTMKTIIRSI